MPSTASAAVERLRSPRARPDRPSGAPRSRAPCAGTRSRTCWSAVQVQHARVGIRRRQRRDELAPRSPRASPGARPDRRGSRGRSTSATSGSRGLHDAGRPAVRGAGVAHELRDVPLGARRHAARRGRAARAACRERVRLLGDDREVVRVVHRASAYENSVLRVGSGSTALERARGRCCPRCSPSCSPATARCTSSGGGYEQRLEQRAASSTRTSSHVSHAGLGRASPACGRGPAPSSSFAARRDDRARRAATARRARRGPARPPTARRTRSARRRGGG